MPRFVLPLRVPVRLLLCAGVLAAAACGGDNGPSGSSPFKFQDPKGDTLANTRPGLPRALDVQTVSGYVSQDSVIFRLEFASGISAANSGNANAAFAQLEIDVDSDPTTGFGSLLDQGYGFSTGLNTEFEIDLIDSTSAQAVFVDVATNTATPIPTTTSGSTLTFRVPRALMPGDDGSFRFAAVAGNIDVLTDVVPNTGSYAVTGPGQAVAAAHGRVAAPQAAVGAVPRSGVVRWRGRGEMQRDGSPHTP